MPRDAVRGVLPKIKTTRGTKSDKAKKLVKRSLSSLDKPKSLKAKIAAGAAGTTLVGLQVGNMAGDAIATRAMAGSGKKKES